MKQTEDETSGSCGVLQIRSNMLLLFTVQGKKTGRAEKSHVNQFVSIYCVNIFALLLTGVMITSNKNNRCRKKTIEVKPDTMIQKIALFNKEINQNKKQKWNGMR